MARAALCQTCSSTLPPRGAIRSCINGIAVASTTSAQSTGAKAVGMSKTSNLRSIKAGRISAGRDQFGQWAIEPCELHRVYPALAADNDTASGTGERAATGGDTALVEANARTSLLEQRISDLKTILDDMRAQRDDLRE